MKSMTEYKKARINSAPPETQPRKEPAGGMASGMQSRKEPTDGMASGMQPRKEISFCREDPGRTVYEAALRLLKYSPRSKKTLKDALAARGFAREHIADSVERLCREGLLNDRLLMYNYCRYLATKKYFGPLRIKRELYRKFDASDADLFFTPSTEDIDFEGLAVKFARRYPGREKEFIIRALKNRGYEYSHIKAALASAYQGGLPQENPDD